MTLYAICTTTRKIRICGEADRIRGEFAVERQLRAMGIEADAAMKITLKRQGKRRTADAIEEPLLAGYVFADIPPELYVSAMHCRGAWGQAMAVPKGAETAQVRKFLSAASEARTEAARAIANGKASVAYDQGDLLEILTGPFRDQLARFRGVVQRAHDAHPKLRLEMQVFGQSVPVEVDPLDVKKAV